MGKPDGEDRNVEIVHPNRDKAASKATRLIVIVLLLASAALVTIISIGGWGTIEGAKALQVAYILLYLVTAYYVARWTRGVLPVIAALAIILAIFAGVAGPQWYDRDKAGFTDPTLDESVLGMLTLLVIPLQILLIAFAMRGFQQAWNVEIERPVGEGRSRGEGSSQGGAHAMGAA